MSFDVAVGVSGAQLNSASASVYAILYPNVFTGSQTTTYQSTTFTVGWNIKTAPAFDLSTPATAEALVAGAVDKAQALGHDVARTRTIMAGLAGSLPSFTVQVSSVDISLQAQGQNQPTILTLSLTAACSIQIQGNQISFVVSQVSAPTQQDAVTNFLVQHVICPAIQSVLNSVLSGLTIPALNVGGIQLTPPSVGIVNDTLIATTNVQGNGTPSVPDTSTPWPQSNLFVLIGENPVQLEMQSLMASASNNFQDSGSGGSSWAGYNWSYDLSLAQPSVSLNGDITVGFSLNGGVSAGVEIVYVSIGLGFNASATPNPTVTLEMVPNGQTVNLVTQSVSDFAILVTPTGSIPAEVVGWLVSAIVTGVATTLEPLVAGFLGGINLTSFSVPSPSIQVGGTTITLTPVDLTPIGLPGYIGATGALQISG